MTLHVGICFGKMSSLHQGLGEYGLMFGRTLAGRAEGLREQHGIELHYRLPDAVADAFPREVHRLAQPAWQRVIGPWAQPFALWHTLHQLDPFRPALRAPVRLATVHDLNHLAETDTRYARKCAARLARVVAGSTHLVAISEHTRADLLREVAPRQPVSVVPNGVRELTAGPRARPASLPETVSPGGYLLHLSRMSALKNPEHLLAMMEHLPGRTLVMAGARSGDSERVQQLVQARAGRPGQGTVHVLFDVSTAEKAWLYAHCQAFLFPSQAEGFGLPLVEALQFGKPVFASTLTSLPEVGGQAARYWPVLEPVAMAQALEAALAAWDPQRDGDAARAQAARFTWARCIDAHVRLYLQLLGREAA